MAAEDYDVKNVGVPIGGKVAYAPLDEENVITASDAGDRELALLTKYPAYKVLGLIKEDGGLEDGAEAGDRIKFFQKGYSISGDDTLAVTFGLAQTDPVVRQFVRGQTPDAHGNYAISQATPDQQFLLFGEVVYKNKQIRRVRGVAAIVELTLDKAENGSVNGWTVKAEWAPHPLNDGEAFYETWIDPVDTAPLSITTVLPASKGAGEEVTFTGTGFGGVTAVAFGATPAAAFTVESSTKIKAVLPPGAAGSVQAKVTRGAESAERAYTRVV